MYSFKCRVEFYVKSIGFSWFKGELKIRINEFRGSKSYNKTCHSIKDNFFEESEIRVLGGKSLFAMKEIEKSIKDPHYYNISSGTWIRYYFRK